MDGLFALFDQQEAVKETCAREKFRHTRISSRVGMIRLLKVLPTLSQDGLVQCEIRQATTRSAYTCLSYTWGPADNDQEIIVNGKSLRCRQNLSSFLHMARTKCPLVRLWIDAVCIDQDNLAERNQQVSQMGQIYSCARTVLIWLGRSAKTARFLSFMSAVLIGAPDNKKLFAKHARTYWHRERTKEVETGWLCFARNTYWTRAWITQELLLAKTIRMLADSVEIGLTELQTIAVLFLPVLDPITDKGRRVVKAQSMQIYLQIMAGDRRLEMREDAKRMVYRMVDLLSILRGRRCEHPRDRIYSMRSVAEDGESIIVNYSASEVEFFLNIVRALRSSMCFCSIAFIIQDVLDLESASIIADSHLFPMITLPMSVSHLKPVSPADGRYRHWRTTRWQSGRPGNKDLGCSDCYLPAAVDLREEYLICLQEECPRIWGTHLVVRKDLRMLAAVSIEGRVLEISIEGVEMEVVQSTRTGNAETIEISMRLDRWIDIALFTRRVDEDMCSHAIGGLDEPSCFATAL